MLKVQVPCYYCHTPNEIKIGCTFYDSDAFYTCYSCGHSTSVSIRQKEIKVSYEVQIGKPVESGDKT